MVRTLIFTFIASFLAVLVMLFLYIYVPVYLFQRFNAQRSNIPEVLQPIKKIADAIVVPQVVPSPSPTPTPSPDLSPSTVIIPKLNIQAAVEPVGVTETNNMDVPKDAANVAWYMYGPAPGIEGNAVIAGHYDTPTGRPAIFWELNKLAPGDEIQVISAHAVRNTFVVTEISSIPYDVFPSEYVFKSKPGKNLNLITCGGIWDRVKKIYTNRIVVYTTLKEG